MRVYVDRLVAAAEGQLLCEHTRIIDRRQDTAGQTVYDWRHYLAVLQRKPRALENGAPFSELPQGVRRLQAVVLKQPVGDREMVEILALVLRHDEQAVRTAVELALEAGVASKTHVLNVLHRLLDGKPVTPAPVTAPQALRLTTEPQANVLRYGSLRGCVTAVDPIIIKEVRHAPCPASAAIVIMLRELKMYGMAHAVAELAEQGSPAMEVLDALCVEQNTIGRRTRKDTM